MPMASTSAKRVMRLIVRPNICMNMNEPISDTGTARVGISVERQSPRKTNTTSETRMNASPERVHDLLDRGVQEA